MIAGIAVVAIAGATGCSTSPSEHVKKGDAYVAQGKTAEAIIEYRGAVQKMPKSGDTRQKLADAYFKAQDAGNALREYVRAADLLPNDKVVQLKAGSLLLVARAFEDAKSRADRVLKMDPKNAEAMFLRASALGGLNQFDEAVKQYEEVIALDPSRVQAYVGIGTIHMMHGRAADAETAFSRGIQAAPDSTSLRLALANLYWTTNRGAEAEATVKELLAKDPANVAANRALGLYYVETGRAADAEPLFKKIADTSKNIEATIALTDYYVAVDRRADAKRLIDQVLAEHPDNREVQVRRASLIFDEGHQDEAFAKASAAVKAEPSLASGHLLLARIHTSRRRYREAIAEYGEVLKLDARPMEALLALSRLQLALGNTDQSLTYTGQALQLQPRSVVAHELLLRGKVRRKDMAAAKDTLALFQRGAPNAALTHDLTAIVQTADNRPDAARASYERALKADPLDLEALSGLAAADLASDRPKDAVARIDAALGRGKPDSDLLLLSARVFSAAGDTTRSVKLLQQAIALDPARLEGYSQLAEIYARGNRLDEAKRELREVLSRDPQSVSAITMLAMLLEIQGRSEEAKKEYQRVLSIDPRAPVAANNLAWLYVSSKQNLDQAMELAQTARQVMPEEPTVSDTLGWIYVRKNLASLAIPHLEASVDQAPTNPTYHFHLGIAYQQLGDVDKARTSLKKALALNSKFSDAAEARRVLASLGS
jgi:tetratricopeptide (TPR) repeat protein